MLHVVGLVAFAQEACQHANFKMLAYLQIAGRWLVDMRDRYSYWHKIMPLLLPGELDDVEELQELARESFVKVRGGTCHRGEYVDGGNSVYLPRLAVWRCLARNPSAYGSVLRLGGAAIRAGERGAAQGSA